MTNATVWTEYLEPAGMVGQAFSLIGRNAGVIIAVSLVFYVPISLAVAGFGYYFVDEFDGILSDDALGHLTPAFIAAAVLIALLYVLGTSLVYAAVTRIALDDAASRPASFGSALVSGFRSMLPVAVVSLVAGIACMFAAVLLILPGLLLMGLWWCAIPAIVEERLGFGSLGRSAALTEGYRWPMVGLVLLYFLVAIGVGMVTSAPGSLLVSFGITGALLSAVVEGVGDALVSVFGTVTAVLAYNRLRQIKEGGGPSVADVFT